MVPVFFIQTFLNKYKALKQMSIMYMTSLTLSKIKDKGIVEYFLSKKGK